MEELGKLDDAQRHCEGVRISNNNRKKWLYRYVYNTVSSETKGYYDEHRNGKLLCSLYASSGRKDNLIVTERILMTSSSKQNIHHYRKEIINVHQLIS